MWVCRSWEHADHAHRSCIIVQISVCLRAAAWQSPDHSCILWRTHLSTERRFGSCPSAALSPPPDLDRRRSVSILFHMRTEPETATTVLSPSSWSSINYYVVMWIYSLTIFWSWGPPQQLGAILTSCSNANVSVPSGPLSLRNGLIKFGIVCLVTLLIFLHSLHFNALLNVSTQWFPQLYIAFCVLVLWVCRCCFVMFFFPGRLLVLYFSLLAPAICCLFFLQ